MSAASDGCGAIAPSRAGDRPRRHRVVPSPPGWSSGPSAVADSSGSSVQGLRRASARASHDGAARGDFEAAKMVACAGASRRRTSSWPPVCSSMSGATSSIRPGPPLARRVGRPVVDEHVPLGAAIGQRLVLERQQEAVAEADLVHADPDPADGAHHASPAPRSVLCSSANAWPRAAPWRSPALLVSQRPVRAGTRSRRFWRSQSSRGLWMCSLSRPNWSKIRVPPPNSWTGVSGIEVLGRHREPGRRPSSRGASGRASAT